MKPAIVFLIFVFSLSSITCTGDDEPTSSDPPCKEENWGHVKVKNNLGETIAFSLDGNFLFNVNCCGASRTYDQTVTAGSHAAEYEDADGDVFSQTITVEQCKTVEVVVN